MHSHLEHDLSNLASLLEQTTKASSDYLNSIDSRPPATVFSKKEGIGLSKQGLGSAKTLELFLERYGNDIPASNGPRFGDWSPVG